MTEQTNNLTDDASVVPAQVRPRGLRASFRRFRQTRPFWGGLILTAGGYFVMQPMLGSSFQMLMHLGASGTAVYILGGGMMVAGIVGICVPSQRHFPALMAMAFSIASLPLANLGGWLIGMILGIVGSGMVFAWTPFSDKQLAKFAERERQKVERKAGKAAIRATRAAA